MIVVITNQSIQIVTNFWSLPGLLSGPPSQIELSSSGGAGEGVGNHLGVFQLLPDGGEGDSQGPVYQQQHHGDNQQIYLYRWDTSNCMLQAFVKLQLNRNFNWNPDQKVCIKIELNLQLKYIHLLL